MQDFVSVPLRPLWVDIKLARSLPKVLQEAPPLLFRHTDVPNSACHALVLQDDHPQKVLMRLLRLHGVKGDCARGGLGGVRPEELHERDAVGVRAFPPMSIKRHIGHM